MNLAPLAQGLRDIGARSLAGAPVDPDTRQARDWLEEELAKPQYTARPGLLERLQDWLLELLSRTGGAGLPTWVIPVVLAVVLATIGLVLWRVLRRDRILRAGDASAGVLDGVTASAAELRARATQALAAGDADAALVDRYRAIVAAAVERVILPDVPGQTAREAARALALPFPSEELALGGIAQEFDAVRYGHRSTTLEAARAAQALDERITATRPQLLAGQGMPW